MSLLSRLSFEAWNRLHETDLRIPEWYLNVHSLNTYAQVVTCLQGNAIRVIEVNGMEEVRCLGGIQSHAAFVHRSGELL